MKEILLKSYRFNLLYAETLVADVDDDLMTLSGGAGLENHPAFTLGHLTVAAAMTSKYLGGPYSLGKGWDRLFRRKGPGDPKRPDPDSMLYPDKNELLSALSSQHQLVEDLVREINEDRFADPATWRFSKHMPTLGDLLYFMCITHESMHLGQLAGWRRSQGLESALAKL